MRLCVIGSVTITDTNVVERAINDLNLKKDISEIVTSTDTEQAIPAMAIAYAREMKLPFRVFDLKLIPELSMFRYSEKVLVITMADKDYSEYDRDYTLFKDQFSDKIIEHKITDTAEDNLTDPGNETAVPDLTVDENTDFSVEDPENYSEVEYTQDDIHELQPEDTTTTETNSETSAG